MVHEFIVACKGNDLNKIKQMIQMIHMVDMNEGFRWACIFGHIDVVKYLVSLGVDIHAIEEEGFRWACHNGHIDVVRYLVQNTDIDIHAKNEYSLMWAWWNGHIDVVRYLVNFMQCVKYRKLNKISQFMPDTYYQWTRKNTYFINVGKYMNHLNNNFIL